MLKGLHLLSRQGSPRDDAWCHDSQLSPLRKIARASLSVAVGHSVSWRSRSWLVRSRVKGMEFLILLLYLAYLSEMLVAETYAAYTEDFHESSNKQPAENNCNDFCTLKGKNVGGRKWKGSTWPWLLGFARSRSPPTPMKIVEATTRNLHVMLMRWLWRWYHTICIGGTPLDWNRSSVGLVVTVCQCFDLIE